MHSANIYRKVIKMENYYSDEGTQPKTNGTNEVSRFFYFVTSQPEYNKI